MAVLNGTGSMLIAPPSRARLADALDNLLTLATAGACWVGDGLMPRLSGRSPTLEEQMIPIVVVVLFVSGLSLFFSTFELSGGTMGQRLAGVRHVRLDGSPMRPRDWLYRHWPSLLCIGLIIALFLIAIFEPQFATVRLAIAWLVRTMTPVAVPCALLIVGGYLLRQLRPRTITIMNRPLRKRGFEVVIPSREGEPSND